jgi:hypothetical protein
VGVLEHHVAGVVRRDHRRRAQRRREGLAHRVGLDHDHLGRAGGPHPLQRRESDGPPTLHDGDVAKPDAAAPHRVKRHRRRLDLRGLLVGQGMVGAHDPSLGHRESHGEAAVQGAGLVASRGGDEHGAALIGPAGAARLALPTGRWHRHHHTVALVHPPHVGSNRAEGPGPLVPADRGRVGPARLVRVHVGAADAAVSDVDHHAVHGRHGLGNIPKGELLTARDHRCSHGWTVTLRAILNLSTGQFQPLLAASTRWCSTSGA